MKAGAIIAMITAKVKSVLQANRRITAAVDNDYTADNIKFAVIFFSSLCLFFSRLSLLSRINLRISRFFA